jgi:HEAT repeat protein
MEEIPEYAQPSPVARLLQLGEPKVSCELEWPNYQALGLGNEHIQALIEIAVDKTLLNIEDEGDPRGWGPVHAWRALGQLQAQEAITPLLRLLHEVKDNDWVIEEMPDVFAMIGPPAFKPLAQYLADIDYPVYSRLTAATGIMELGRAYPELRDQSVETLASYLEYYSQNTPGMNGVLIANLVELGAVEKADLILDVFTNGLVDRFIVGDWRDVQVILQGTGKESDSVSLRSAVRRVPPNPGRSEARTRQRASSEPHTRPIVH